MCWAENAKVSCVNLHCFYAKLVTSLLTLVSKQRRTYPRRAVLGMADASPELKTTSTAHLSEPLLLLFGMPQMCLTTVGCCCVRNVAVTVFRDVCRRHGAFSPASACGWAWAHPQVDVLDADSLPRHLTFVGQRMQRCPAWICSVFMPNQ